MQVSTALCFSTAGLRRHCGSFRRPAAPLRAGRFDDLAMFPPGSPRELNFRQDARIM
jgi:hypothetical protein